MSVTEDMISYLTSAGLQATFFNAYRPPDRVGPIVVVTPYGGSEPSPTMDDYEDRIEYPRFQVEALDTDGAVAEAIVISAANRIAAIQNEQVNGTWYLRVREVSSPAFLQRDELDRVSYVASFEAMKAIDVPGLGS